MNNDVIKGNWEQLKGKVRQVWAKLTDDDMEHVEGNWEELAGRLQKTYGYSKEKAWEEVENFRSTHSDLNDDDGTNLSAKH